VYASTALPSAAMASLYRLMAWFHSLRDTAASPAFRNDEAPVALRVPAIDV